MNQGHPMASAKRKIEEGWDGFGADPNEAMQWLHSSQDVIEEPGTGLNFDEYNPAFIENVINEIVDPDWGASGLSLSEQLNFPLLNAPMLVPQTPAQPQQGQQFQPRPQQPSQPTQPQPQTQFTPVQPQQPNPTAMVARSVLSSIEDMVRTTNVTLAEIAQHQRQIVDRPNAELYTYLSKTQKQLEAEITNGYNQLQQMMDSTYLDCNEMSTVLGLQKQQSLQKKQLELYIEELEGMLKDNSIPRLALVLVSQPFPNSVKQNAKIEEPVIVQLLTGAKSNIKPNCIVKAEIISGTSGKKSGRNAPIKIENAEKQLNDQGLATFNDMKFPIGTRLKSIRFKCTTSIKLPDRSGHMHSIELETLASNSIVVKTNENQWGEAEGILLKKTIFDGRSEIPWHRFANWLQRRYVLGTRQNIQSPTRPLNVHDFKYIHRTKFDSKPVITQAQFDKFWEWFGPLLHKIRHQRFMAQLWTKGYISGFLSREEVDPVLRNEKIGTFIIRFSENRDTFAISYQAGDDSGLTRVKHYLIKSDDTHGAKKNMADFLREFRDLTILLQLFTEKGTDRRILCRCQKDEALSEFYSKKADASCDGYDDDIDVS